MGDAQEMRGGVGRSKDSCPWSEVRPSRDRVSNSQNSGGLGVWDAATVSVGRKLGEGGQGCIYDANHYTPFYFTPLPVAVKKFKFLVGISHGRFSRRIVGPKWHDVCKPVGVFFEGDIICTVMRRYSCDLRAEIDSRMENLQERVLGYDGPPFHVTRALAIVSQVAMAMSALHESGICHKDLKAANILVQKYNYFQKNGEPRMCVAVADFEESEGVVGTGFYRAPEVLQSLLTGVPLSASQWFMADIYSFGMVCYEVLTGKVPFDGHRISDYGVVLDGGRPQLPDHVPEYLKDIMRRCWQSDPSSRPRWEDIIQCLSHLASCNGYYLASCNVYDEYHDVLDKERNHIIKMASIEYFSAAETSMGSILMKLKRGVHKHWELHACESKEFADYWYWTLEFVAALEEYVSKFDVQLPAQNPLVCSLHEATERTKLQDLLELQQYGCNTRLYMSGIQIMQRNRKMEGAISDFHEVQFLMLNVHRSIDQVHSLVEVSHAPVGFSWIGWLFYSRSHIKWQLWTEVMRDRLQNSIMGLIPHFVSPNAGVPGAMFFYVCLTITTLLDTYIYTLALFSSEPILLGVQYGLFMIQGRNSFMYRSSGYRICRLQRAWINFTRHKLLCLALIFSLFFLFGRYGWRGVLVWNLFPCLLRFSPYWKRCILKH